MKLKIALIILFVIPSIGFAQIDCSKLLTGSFEIKTDFGNVLVQRFKGFQLEKFIEYGVIYLYKIEQIDNCEYILKIQKVISKGDFPSPDINQSILVKVYERTENAYYYQSTESSTQIKMDGIIEKKSNSVSDEFKDMLQSQ